ncbi:hypothetical protein [Actinocrispum sp. NPDC049592]|uniref:hypothetical protein n=1 Tax=Actinocrispum sp. NPDC049592 TaxID=3154835 RepID=UPI003413E9DF
MKPAFVLVVPALAVPTFDSPRGPIPACVLPLIALLAAPTLPSLTGSSAPATGEVDLGNIDYMTRVDGGWRLG